MGKESFLRRRAAGSWYGKSQNKGTVAANLRNRSLRIEHCEDRLLLSISPTALQLVSISPYETSILGTTPPTNALIYGAGVTNKVTTEAPTELVLDFNQGQNIDPATLGAIQVFRSGGDNQFQTVFTAPDTYTTNPLNTAMDVPVPIGSATINQTLNTTNNTLSSNEVVIRFAQDLPADLYEIVIIGKANSPLDGRPAALQTPLGGVAAPATPSGATDQPFDGGQDQVIDFTLNLGAQVSSVVPQPVTRNASGSLSQATNEIDVYFNQQMNPASAQDPTLYQLIVTNNTANTNYQTIVPSSDYTVQYSWNATTGISESRLIFKAALNTYDPALASGTPGSFRLAIGTQYYTFDTNAITAVRSPDETFAGADANDLGPVDQENPISDNASPNPLGGETWIINGTIQPQQSYDLEWPGGLDTPGVRDLPDQPQVAGESHFDAVGVADASDNIPTFFYNFADEYNTADPAEHNEITAAQETLVRDIFQLYGTYLGVKFEETYAAKPVAGQMTIVTGDLAALGGVSGNTQGEIGLAGFSAEGSGEAIMDGSVNWGNNEIGGEYYAVAMHEIGHLLGYGHDDDTPELSVMNAATDPTVNLTPPDDILPSAQDITVGQYMYRTDSSGIDLYRFELPTSGTLNLETIAQEMQNSSALSSYLILYNSQDQVVARNGEYFGTDSYISMANLPAGTYYVGVSASGNENYNPLVPLSGMGGTSQGPYELRISFSPSPAAPAAVAADNNITLGNSPTVPVTFTAGTAPFTAGTDSGSGQAAIITSNFSSSSISTLAGKTFQITKGTNVYTFEFVDSSNPSGTFGLAAQGDLALSFNSQTDTVSSILEDVAAAINNAVSNLVDTTATPLDGGDTGTPGGQYNFWFNVEDANHTIFVDKVASAATATGALGTITNPYTTISAALSAAPGPAVLQEDGNITLNNSTTAFTYTQDTSPFPLGTDSGTAAIVDIDQANLPGATTLTLQARMALLNGELFQVTRTSTGVVTTFQFVDVYQGGSAASGNQAVYYDSASDTPTSLQTIITNAINNAVQPGKIVRIEGNNTAANAGNTIVAVAADTNTGAAQIQNGDSFTIADGLQTLTFEFERNAASVAPGAVLVLIHDTDTAQQVANEIAAAINSVSVNTTKLANGLHATATVVQNSTTLQWEIVVSGPSVTVNLGTSIASDPLQTLLQNIVPYEIGTDPLGDVLSDGATMNVPQGVTVMIDSGAVFKLMAANIEVGSQSLVIDRSLAAIQVLGTPVEDAYFTSWDNERIGSTYYVNSQGANPGDWGGIVYENDYDYEVQTDDPSRQVLEQQGIFLDYVNHADITYGGGQVSVNGIKDYYDPIYLIEARPSLTFNTIMYSEHAGISADPNSFEESLFQNTFGESLYTADYERAGPQIYGNIITNNTYNGVLIRVTTAAGSNQEELTTDASLTSTDAVYIMTETLEIAGNPGGGVDNVYSKGSPVTVGDSATTNLSSGGDNELVVPAGGGTGINDLESFILSDTYLSVRFEFDYFNSHGASTGSVEIPILNTYTAAQVAAAIAASINSSGLKITATAAGDDVELSGAIVVVKGLTEVDARVGGRLNIAPGVIVKLSAARIEAEVGSEFIAEGTIDRPIIFTSLLDQNYGAGGTFDTADENSTPNPKYAAEGDWSGLYFSPTSFGSMDYTRVYYAGGTSAIEGGFANFAPVEIRQAQVRITNSVFEDNQSVAEGDNRNGRGELLDATGIFGNAESAVIYISGAQPILVNDVILDNSADAISVDCNSLDSFQNQDWGRSTGPADVFSQYASNVGPMIQQIKLANNDINGLTVRSGTMVTEGVWDETDIVYVVEGPIVIPNETIYGGLKLDSNSLESLVVKLLTVNTADPAELLATGTPLEIQGRIGGSLQVLGTPGHPVVLTSLNDDTVGAGFDPWGNPEFNTVAPNANAATGTPGAAPAPGDWDSLILDTYSNDYNVAEINQFQPAYGASNTASTIQTAQYLGQLATSPDAGDDTLRLGFEVQGAISYSNPQDVDVYSFQGTAGTEVWLDIDRTTYALDSEIELLDANGKVLATAYASIDPATGDEISPQFIATGVDAAAMDPDVSGSSETPGSLVDSTGDTWFTNNMYSTNPNDAAMRVVLPGTIGQQDFYYVRVSSHSGKSSGNYELQIRLQSTRVTPGSVVQYATIDYAENGVQVLGKPDHSPLEDQNYDYVSGSSTSTPNQSPANVQPIGNLLASDENVLNVAGYLDTYQDVDWYSFNMNYNYQTGGSTIEIPKVSEFPVVFDIGYASGLARPDAVIWVFNSAGELILHGTGSQIADEQVEPLQGANSGNLTHASYSTGDGYVGPVYLPTNSGTYYVAITTLGATSVQESDPLLRWQPVDSTNLIADDNVGSQNAAKLPTAPPFVLFPGTTPAATNTAAVPFTLGNVPLYVLTSNALYTTDPYTGAMETEVSDVAPDVPNELPYTGPQSYGAGPLATYGDLAMRNDGELFAVTNSPGTTGVNENTWSGASVNVNTGNASDAPAATTPDGIITYGDVAGAVTEYGAGQPYEPGGIRINATTYGPSITPGFVGSLNEERALYAVGNDAVGPAADPPPATQYGTPANYGLDNLLYVENEDGVAEDPPGIVNDDGPRIPTNIIPMAQLLTGSTIFAPTDGASSLVSDADTIGNGNDILDGTQFTITDSATPANTVSFEFDSGPDLDLGTYGSEGVRNGQEFSLTEQTASGPLTKTFQFISGPVLIFHNDVNGSLNGATFTVTDDKGVTQYFEFISSPATNPVTTPITGYTVITVPVNSTAQTVANLAVTAINGASFDTKAALGEYGDAADDVDPLNGSTWARVSLIQDNLNDTPAGDGNLIQVEGSYNKTDPNAIPIYYKETYNNPTFLAIETAIPVNTPQNPETATDLAEGFPWATSFAAQIQAVVDLNMAGIKTGYSDRTVGTGGPGTLDSRVNFYGAINAYFGQSTALIHYAGLANADFNVTSVDGGAQYNGVQVVVEDSGAVTGNAANVTFAPGPGGIGGTLTIDVDSGVTTALTVVNAINAYAQAEANLNPSIPTFTASLDASEEQGGTNTGAGFVGLTATPVLTAGGINNGVITWTDATGDTPQVENKYSPWGQVWTWRLGANNTGGPDAPLSGTGLQSEYTNDQLIPFGAGDSAATIAEEIAGAINYATSNGLFTVVATADADQVALTNVSTTALPTGEQPLTIEGAGPGGNITGMAYLNGNFYAVSSNGGVYLINNIDSPEFETLPNLAVPNPPAYTPATIQYTGGGAELDYLGAINGADFQGLTAGPPDVNNGEYTNTLFAISSTGVLYALSPDNVNGIPGVVQAPVFLNGATSVATGLTNATGLAFTTLDYNLWHVTNQEGGTVGHGVNPTYDFSQVSLPGGNGEAVEGGESFYFGLENPTAATTISTQPGAINYYVTNPGVYNTYNLPDGAAGSLETQPFSLASYSAGDQPIVSFTYNLNKGDPTNDDDNPLGFDQDTAKVFASNDGANWTELSTPGNNPAGLADTGGTWMQVQYSLAAFAGDSSVRLRFDFSTAGDMGVGANEYSGASMTALSGEQINDGDTFEINNQTFEFDMGEALFLPNVAGDVIVNGETFTIPTGAAGSTTFQFVSSGTATAGNVAIPYVIGETTDQVATEIKNIVNAQALKNDLGVTIVADVYQNRVMLNNATGLTLSANSTLNKAAFIPTGLNQNGADDVAANNVPVPIQSTWTAAQVAAEIATMMDEHFSAGRTLQAVAGSAITSGQTFSLTDSKGVTDTFEFDLTGTNTDGNIPIQYAATDAAANVAAEITAAVNASGLNMTAGVTGTTVALNGPIVLFTPGTSPIELTGNQNLTRAELAANDAAGDYTAVQLNGSVLDVIGNTVNSPGGGTSTMPYSATLPGDTIAGQPYNRFDGTADNGAARARGQDNDYAGWYVDDVMVGFAERGEMATVPAIDPTASTSMNFNFTPIPKLTSSGYYTLQIRRASDYGVYVTPTTTPPVVPPLTVTAPIDINDRLSDSLSMTLPDATDISNGETFTISDDTESVTFQYLGQGVNDSASNPNDQPIYFTSDETTTQIATLTAAAINLANTRGLFTVEATVGGVKAAGDKVDQAGIYLFQAVSFTTSWTAPTVAAGLPKAGTDKTVQYTKQGDVWSALDQGEDIIEQDSILNSAQYGIAVESVPPLPNGSTTVGPAPIGDDPASHPYSVGVLRAVDADRLVPGIMLENNVLAYGGLGGILFSGDPNVTGATQAAVPFGRIVNNTIYGNPTTSTQTLPTSSFTALTGKTGTATPATTTVYRIDLNSTGLNTITSLTITDNSGSLAAGPTGAYSGLDLDGLLVSNKLAASAAAAAALTGQNVFNFTTGIAFVPGTQNAPVAPNLFGTENNQVDNAVATLQAFDASGPSSPNPSGFVALGVGGVITFNLSSPITVVPGTYLYIAVSEDLGQFADATITATGQSIANSGTGILVENNASPTILNNIVADLNTGISVLAPANDVSSTTVVGYSLYQNDNLNHNLQTNNISNADAVDTDAIYATAAQQLFVNAAAGNFYPAPQAPEIDSSVSQLNDRPSMISVDQPLGIPPSPILAPQYDLYGLLRKADPQVSPYPGLGSNPYIDRGAINRDDLVGPISSLVTPQDLTSSTVNYSVAGSDIDPRATWVTTTQQQTLFAVQLSDPTGPGIENSSVVSSNVVLTEDPDNNPADIKTLVEGTDYFFEYDSTDNIIHLIPAAGIWAEGYTYNILLTTGILNLAGNPLQPNRTDNTNQFTIVLAGPNGSNSVPAAGIEFSQAPGYPVAWQVEPTTPTLYLGTTPPTTTAAYVGLATRSYNNGAISSATLTIAQGSQVTIPVTVTDTGTAPAYLDAWIDFAGDKTFSDAGDQVVTDQVVTNGVNNITFTVPTGLSTSAIDTWIRFRVSTQQGLTSTGGMPLGDIAGPAVAEPDGEVEDFNNVVVVPPPVPISGTVFEDYNKNGVQDTGEPGLAGWTVFLDVAGTGKYVATDPSAVTNASGQYTLSVGFTNLASGTYNVIDEPPAGTPAGAYAPTKPASGSYSLNVTSGLSYPGENFGNYYTLPPTVVSIVKLDADPTNEAILHYAVSFIDPVGHVVAGDFAVVAPNFPNWSISSITAATPLVVGGTTYSATWDVDITTGAVTGGTGTFELNLDDSSGTIVDTSGNHLTGTGSGGTTFIQPSSGAVYHIDRVQPTVVSIVPDLGVAPAISNVPGQPAPVDTLATISYYVDFLITFSKPVVDLYKDSPNFPLSLAASGLTGDSIMTVNPVAGSNDTQYLVEAFTGNVGSSGAGTLGLNLSDPGDEIHDLAGNTLTGPGSGSTTFTGTPVYTISRVQPVAYITPAASQANPTSTSPIDFTVTFAIDNDTSPVNVTGFTAAGVNLSFSYGFGSSVVLTDTVTPVNPVNGYASTYTVAVSGMQGTGTVAAWVMSNVAQDDLGNENLYSAKVATVNYSSIPTVSIAAAAGQKNPVNVGPLNFTVTFNQAVVGFTASTLNFTGSTAPGVSGKVGVYNATITGSGPVYNVSVTGMTGTGRVQLNIAAGAVKNAFGSGNTASTGTTNYVYYDITPPSESLVNPANGASVLSTTLNSQGYLEVAYSAVVGVGVNTSTITTKGPQFTLSGTAAAGVTIAGDGISLGADNFEYKFNGKFAAGAVTVNFIAKSFQDNAGNYNQAASYSFNVVPGLSVSNVTVAKPVKGSVNAVFTVSLSSAASSPVTVRYATANGTNTTAGVDYAAESGSLTFNVGQTTKSVSVPVLANSSKTSPKTFLLVLSSPSTNALIVQGTGTATISNAGAAVSAAAAVLQSPATVGAAPLLSDSMVAAVAAAQSSVSDSSNKKQTAAADAVFATLMSMNGPS